MTLEQPSIELKKPISKDDNAPPNNTVVTQNRSENLHPVRKKDNAKAWLLTLALHFLIAGGLVSYWYYFQHPQAASALSVEVPAVKPLSASVPAASAIATLSTVVNVSSAASQTASMALASSATTPTSSPLATYVARQQAQQPAQSYNLPSNSITAVQMPTTITTTQQKVITHEPTVKKALTDRDIAKNEKAAITFDTAKQDTSASQNALATDDTPAKETATAKYTDEQKVTDKHTAASASPEKEASNLSRDIDVDNDRLSQLIDQVKEKNQRQIEAQTGSKAIIVNTPTDADNKPASAP